MADNTFDVSLITGATARVDVAHRAIADLAGQAELLRKAIVHSLPVGVLELRSVSNAVMSAATRLNDAFSLWLRIADNNLPASLQRTSMHLVDAIRQNADAMVQAALDEDSKMPPTDNFLALARSLLALVEPLRKVLSDVQPMPQPETDP